jgi:hypothetical protein
LPQAQLSPLKPLQQNAITIAHWIYESASVRDAARPGIAA